LQQEHELEIHWRAFPLHPETPAEGKSLAELFADTTVDVTQMLSHLHQVAESLGLPFGNRTMTYNSRLAQELGLWAETQGSGPTFHMAAFHAYFAEGKNLAQRDVLLDLAERAGLDPAKAAGILDTRAYRHAVDADWRLSREKGVTAVPTFIVNGRSLTGARPYSDLEAFVRNAPKPTIS